jgi:2-polyprenyl-3-methyl-5-hydroxy-6-metoxy-1,4-benzoquinol methylase
MPHLGLLTFRLAASMRRRFWLAPRGEGRPVPVSIWEDEYRRGAWNYLENLNELAHYMAIVGYAMQDMPKPDILDVGCGHGRLLRLLPASSFRNYLGIDFSNEAVTRAQHLQTDHARFVVADFETWSPAEPVDIIIFNESLYNSRRPAELVARYSQFLKPGGRIIVSIYKAAGDGAIWKKLNCLLYRRDGIRIIHDDQQQWQVALFTLRGDGGKS